MMDEIEIVAYDARWPALYEAERMRLLPVLDPVRAADETENQPLSGSDKSATGLSKSGR
jgi:hypothetical protein